MQVEPGFRPSLHDTSSTVTPFGIVIAAKLTITGTLRSVVVPSPSSPLALRPQHHTVLSLITMQLWNDPVDSDRTDCPAAAAADRSTATGRLLSDVPLLPRRPRFTF